MTPRLRWWALRRFPNGLPEIFFTYDAACYNADPDQAVYEVRIETLRCVKKAQRRQPKTLEEKKKTDTRVVGSP